MQRQFTNNNQRQFTNNNQRYTPNPATNGRSIRNITNPVNNTRRNLNSNMYTTVPIIPQRQNLLPQQHQRQYTNIYTPSNYPATTEFVTSTTSTNTADSAMFQHILENINNRLDNIERNPKKDVDHHIQTERSENKVQHHQNSNDTDYNTNSNAMDKMQKYIHELEQKCKKVKDEQEEEEHTEDEEPDLNDIILWSVICTQSCSKRVIKNMLKSDGHKVNNTQIDTAYKYWKRRNMVKEHTPGSYRLGNVLKKENNVQSSKNKYVKRIREEIGSFKWETDAKTSTKKKKAKTKHTIKRELMTDTDSSSVSDRDSDWNPPSKKRKTNNTQVSSNDHELEHLRKDNANLQSSFQAQQEQFEKQMQQQMRQMQHMQKMQTMYMQQMYSTPMTPPAPGTNNTSTAATAATAATAGNTSTTPTTNTTNSALSTAQSLFLPPISSIPILPIMHHQVPQIPQFAVVQASNNSSNDAKDAATDQKSNDPAKTLPAKPTPPNALSRSKQK